MALIRPSDRAGFALFLVLLAATAPIEGSLLKFLDKCPSGCDGVKPTNQKFAIGTTYKYDYDGKINILLSSAEGQQTTTEVKATVLLTQLADCEQVLKLDNVLIVGPDGKKRAGIPDVDKPIRINNRDGLLSDHVCAEEGDTQHSVNLKRAIASMFQTQAQDNHETDVFGRCPVRVTSHIEGGHRVIVKNKNLNKCAYRETISANYITAVVDLDSEIKTTPYLNSHYDAKIRMKNGVIDQATINEHYLYVPFSVGDNGAKAKVESKLTLIGTSKDTPKNKCQKPRSIIFENPHPINAQKSNVNVLLSKLKEISANVDVSVNDKTALEFINLIKLLRVSKKDDILAVYNQVRAGVGFKDKDGAKKIFLDAILSAGIGDTIEVAIELLKNKELKPLEERLVYLGLNKAQHVTEKSVQTATELLNRPNLPREAYLGVGSLAGQFCKNHPCEKVDAINKLTHKLLQKLGDLKAANRKEEDDMIYALKALANIGHLNEGVLSKLTSLAENKKQPNRLRVAALDAYLAAPCEEKIRHSAIKELKDDQQDSEIRIKAFLALAECPNAKVGNIIKTLLEQEQSLQVGGFISSYIKNARSSANPDKNLVKKHLGFITTPRRFPIDWRKFSNNIEVSSTVEALGLSHSTESNLIYSQNSWLPRSANLNLTAEIFGQRFNFLELQARQENLDRVIEHYLGPKGVLRSTTLQGAWDQTVKPVEGFLKTLKEKVEKSLRARRDVSAKEIDDLNAKIDARTNDLNNDLDLDLSVKNFGREIFFLNSFEHSGKFSAQNLIDTFISKLNTGLDNLKSFDKTFRSNLLILDAELSYPTSLGFPLRLGVDGSANVQIKTSGSIDVRKLTKKDSEIKASVIPSGTVTVGGRFTLDTPLLENGLKVYTTLHTSTGGDVVINGFNSGLGLDVKLSFPVQKQKLIEAKHDIIFQTVENGVALMDTKLKFAQNKEFSVCLDQLVNFVGLEYCAEFYGPNLSGKQVPVLPFPLSGDAKAIVRIEGSDISQVHYRREVKVGKERSVELLLETLDKNNAQRVVIQAHASDVPDKFVKVLLKSPIKNAEAEARLVLNDKEKVLSVSLKDEGRLYAAKAGIVVEGNTDKSIYKPVLEYITPGNKGPQVPPFHVEGKVIAERKGENVKYTLDQVKLIIPNQKPLTVNGHLGHEGHTAYFTDLSVSEGALSGSLKGRIEKKDHALKYHVQLENSINPSFNFKSEGDYKKEKDVKHIDFLLVHGKDLNSKVNRLTWSNAHSYSYNKEKKELHVVYKNQVAYPLYEVEYKLNYEVAPKHANYDFAVQYQKIKVSSQLLFKLNRNPNLDYQLEFNLNGLDQHLKLKSNAIGVSPIECQIANQLEVNGKKTEVAGKIKHGLKANDVKLGADLVIKLPTHATPFKLVTYLTSTPQKTDGSFKLQSGSNQIADVGLKASKGFNVNAHAKIIVKDIFEINGNIKAQKAVGSGEIVIDAKLLKKVVKAETKFAFKKPSYDLDVTVYPTFKDDKTKKIHLSSKNKETGPKIESRNNLDVLGQNFDLVLVHVNDNKGKRAYELELTTPSQKYLALKYGRDTRRDQNKLVFGNVATSAEYRPNKNAPGKKIALVLDLKGTSLRQGLLNLQVKLAGDDAVENKNVNAVVDVNRSGEGQKYKLATNTKLSASFLKHPVEVAYTAQGEGYDGSYGLKSTGGADFKVNLSGKYSVDPEKTLSSDAELDAVLPLEVLQVIKASGNFAAHVRPKENDFLLKFGTSLSTRSKSIKNLNIEYKDQIYVKATNKNGEIKITSDLSQPISASLDFMSSAEYSADLQKGNGQFKISAQGKTVKGSSSYLRKPHHAYKFDAELELPTATHKHNKLSVDVKRSDGNKRATGDIKFTSDGQQWTLTSDVIASETKPSVDLKLTDPEKKVTEFHGKIERASDKRVAANVKASSQKRDFRVEAALDVNAEDIDNLSLELKADAPKLHVDKFALVLKNKGAAEGRKFDVSVKNGGKVVVAGNGVYSAREEQGKQIVEGSGSFKINGESKSGNFKYIRALLTASKNGEVGEEVSFDAALGNKAVDAELKITDKQFRYLNSYCEEKKQCSHVEIDVKSNRDAGNFNHETEIAIDLRNLGLPTEFGFKSVTNQRNGVVDQTTDVHLQNGPNKYQYSSYVHPKEAGVSLSTPKRTIALEGKVDKSEIAKGKSVQKAHVAFYTDKKNNPNSKTSLEALVEADQATQQFTSEVKLHVIGLPKPLTAKYNEKLNKIKENALEVIFVAELDVFAQPDGKLIFEEKQSLSYTKDSAQSLYELQIASKALNVDTKITRKIEGNLKQFTASYDYSGYTKIGNRNYDFGAKFVASPNHVSVLLKPYGITLLKSETDLKWDKNVQSYVTEVSGLLVSPHEGNAVVSKGELKNFNTFKSEIYNKEKPNDKLVTIASLIPGEIADLRSEIVHGSSKVTLLKASVSLSQKNFLKSTFELSRPDVQKLLEIARTRTEENVKNLSKKEETVRKEFVENFQKTVSNEVKESVPNFMKTKEFYSAEAHKFKDELAEDKTLAGTGEFLKSLFGSIVRVIASISEQVGSFFESITKVVIQTASELQNIQKEIYPRLQNVAEKLTNAAGALLKSASEIVTLLVGKLADILEKIQPQLKAISEALNEISEEFGRFFVKVYDSVKHVVVEQLKKLKDELKSLPIFKEIQVKYEELKKQGIIPRDLIINTLRTVTGALKETIFVPEFQKVLDMVEKYLEKKIQNKPVDDVEEIKKIYKATSEAVTKLSKTLSKDAVPDFLQNLNRKTPFSLDLISRLPDNFGAIKLSPVSYILGEDIGHVIKSVSDIITNFHDWKTPIDLDGFYLLGNVKTIDGKHVVTTGSCSFLLARDAVDGNFTLVGSVNDREIQSVQLSDKSGSVKIDKDSKVYYNGAEVSHPVQQGTLKAYRDYDKIRLISDYGIEIQCDLNLLGCGIRVSGFYHGKLRGLLGNGNNEPYDDYTLPSGKIASSATDFVNHYKVGACSRVQNAEPLRKQNDKCDKVFGWDSPLRYCLPFVDKTFFKDTCEDNFAAGKSNADDVTGEGYTHLCVRRAIPVQRAFGSCHNSDATKKLYEKFAVTLPGKSADVVLVVSADKSNEEAYNALVKPLVEKLVGEFKSKGISDVQFHLIANNGEYDEPVHVTAHGKMYFKDKAPELKFAESRKPATLQTGRKRIDEFVQKARVFLDELAVAIGLKYNDHSALYAAYKYPFRAEALKVIVVEGVKETCKSGHYLPWINYGGLADLVFGDHSISAHRIKPINDLKLKDEQTTKDVIGFDRNTVYTMSEPKGKPLADLSHDDWCAAGFVARQHGNAFALDNFLSNKAKRGVFIDAVAKGIVKSALSRNIEMECECNYKLSPYDPENICTVTNVADK